MIEIRCPACGAGGRASADKVNTRLICRKCLKVFHVTASGRAVLGEPHDPGAAQAPQHDHHVPDSAQKVDQFFEQTRRSVLSPKGLVIGLALLAAIVAAIYYSTRKGPESLEDTASRVARATVQGDLQSIRAVSLFGTEAEAIKWYDSIRTQCDELRQRLGSNRMRVEVAVKQQDMGAGTAETLARIETEEGLERKAGSLPDPTMPAVGSDVSLSLPMAWKSEGWAGWKLDARKTLELGPASP
ncbi:hypothetical protein [Aquisphaera insulae]|uniref:hypothetical protein n=1 Tax=Aquisphaera insulae TaxID=2712864 RepID=UPI0013EBC651|nr:hypothetical protein [Aquisphaera insulae]